MQKLEADFQQLLAGAQAELPATLTLHVDGEQLTQPELIAKLQGILDVFERAAAAKAAYGIALQAQQQMVATAAPFKVACGQAVRHVLGKASPALASFGLNAQQRKVPTAETQILAQAKRLATRKARGTLGKRQKLKIKGAPVATVTLFSGGDAVATTSGSESLPFARTPS
jgi:hypothetical protein